MPNSDYLNHEILNQKEGEESKIMFVHDASQLQTNLHLVDSALIEKTFLPQLSEVDDYNYLNEPKIYQYPLTQIELQHVTTKGFVVAPEQLFLTDPTNPEATNSAWVLNTEKAKLEAILNVAYQGSSVPEVHKIFANFTNGYYQNQYQAGIGLFIKNNYTLPYANSSWYDAQSYNNMLSTDIAYAPSQTSSVTSLEEVGQSQVLQEVGVNLQNYDLANRDSRLQVGGDLISDLALGDKFAEGIRLKLNIKQAKQLDQQRYAAIFHKYGYNINDMIDKELLFNGRKYFNYVKVNSLSDYLVNNYVNNQTLSVIKQAFKNGVRFWHQYEKAETDENLNDYSQILINNKINFLNFSKDNDRN